MVKIIKRIKDGDLVIHGLLNQIWFIKKSVKKGLIARIVSNDGGQGYEAYVKDLGFNIKENNTRIIGNIYSREFDKIYNKKRFKKI